MYKVFLVEDEETIRARIRDNFDWAEHKLQLVGEAADGELALPLIYESEPDILITDIKMPFMNGLDLSKLVRKKMPWIKIIIISGHDDFKYAKEAISLSVSEYVLKPVRPSQLSEILNKVISSLDKEKKKINDLEEYEKLAKEELSVQREKFLLETIIYGVIPSDLFEKADMFNINLQAKFYAVMLLKFTPDKSLETKAQYIEILKLNKMLEQISIDSSDILTAEKTLNENLFIITSNDEESLFERISALTSKLKQQSEELISGKLRIGQGKICSRISELSDSYNGAESALEYSFLFNDRDVMAEEDIEHITLAESGLLDLKSERLMNFFKFNRKEDIDSFLSEFLILLSNSFYSGKFLIRFVYMFILLAAGRFIESLSGDPKTVLSGFSQLEDDLLELDNIEEFREKAGTILENVIEFRTSRNFSKYRKPIERAKKYMMEQFNNPNLSLQEVADIANFSSCRFSTIFKKETGDTFSSSLTNFRMEKAMEYLKTTSMQSSEIARAVGYNDSHYFSYIFKKVNGVSPTQFREQIG